ncbi:DUF2203 domain-containing protein [Planctomycetaceae bacterium SH139]
MRYFTPESANRTLPLVRRIAADLVGLRFEVVVRGERIDQLSEANHGLTGSPAHVEELEAMQSSLLADRERMREIEAELSSLGVLVHALDQGALDFPARIGSQDVRLCWVPADEKVSFWHPIGADFADRQPIGDTNFDQVESVSEDPDNGSETDSQPSLKS